MEIQTVEDVSVTCPTTMPRGQDVVISWKTHNKEVEGLEISVGTAPGLWDLFTDQFGPQLKEARLPALPSDLTEIYIEFRYIVPYVHSENATTGTVGNTMEDHDRWEIRLLHEDPLRISIV